MNRVVVHQVSRIVAKTITKDRAIARPSEAFVPVLPSIMVGPREESQLSLMKFVGVVDATATAMLKQRGTTRSWYCQLGQSQEVCLIYLQG